MAHIVVIVVDAMRADHIGCYAGGDRGTPHMDALAREGVLFRAATTQAPWTRPAVTSIMTGLYPSQHVMVDAPKKALKGPATVAALDPSLTTIAEIMTEAGYSTGAFLNGNANLKPLFGLTRGFTHVEWKPTMDGAVAVGDFTRWIKESRPERSFSYLHLQDVHNPLPAEIMPTRPAVDRGVDLRAIDAGVGELLEYYAASVRRADGNIGRLVQGLDDAGVLHDSWIIVTADHGEELNEHGAMLSHGQSLYRQLLQVPMIMAMPGRSPRGKVVDEPVQHIDLMPTFAAYVGAEIPLRLGQSMLPLIDATETGSRTAFSELLKRGLYSRSAMTATHHLVETYILQRARTATLSDLEAGTPVEVKGQPVQGGGFVPTKVALAERPDQKVLGSAEGVDAAGGCFTVMGLTFHLAPAAEMVGLEKEPFTLAELLPGDRLNVAFHTEPDGTRVATKLMRRKEGGESKLEGPIEEVVRSNGTRSIRLLGREVRIDPDAVRIVNGIKEKTTWTRYDVLPMVLAGRYVEKRQELFEIVTDPQEQRSIADAHPELVRDLAARLEAWTGSMTGIRSSGGVVDIDAETIDQLRDLGYVE